MIFMSQGIAAYGDYMSQKESDNYPAWIVSMNRKDLIGLLRRMNCAFAMDFTDEFLNSISIERLRHIVMAARLNDKSAKKEVPA